ncbi:MAG: HEPN domain-containing protein [Chloroflexi bacterium]|nr:HEPN domain-containing protein [Chloroflexota bacterium]
MKTKSARRLKEHRTAYATQATKPRAPRDLAFPQARFLTPQERRALKQFRDHLLAKYPDQVERIVLFGSKARGDFDAESDIDVLVVVGGAGSKEAWEPLGPNWTEVVHHTSDLALQHSVGISPKFEWHDAVMKWSPLLDHIHKEGIELWRRPGTEWAPWPPGGEAAMALRKQEHIQARMAMAKDKLRAARKMREEELYNDVISRAYYAMFYASKALLLALGEDPHKHQGVVSLYGERIAKVGLSDPKYGTVLRDAKDLREEADYQDFFRATKEQAENAIRNAEDFVREAEETLKKIQARGK